jgi:hypothetical protein
VNSIAARFQDHVWHDSKLLSWRTCRVNREDQVRLKLMMLQRLAPPQLMEMVLEDSVVVEAHIDLVGKRDCSDDLAGAMCTDSSAWFMEIKKTAPYYEYSGLFHFSFELISPGGALNVLARNFALVLLTPNDDA